MTTDETEVTKAPESARRSRAIAGVAAALVRASGRRETHPPGGPSRFVWTEYGEFVHISDPTAVHHERTLCGSEIADEDADASPVDVLVHVACLKCERIALRRSGRDQ